MPKFCHKLTVDLSIAEYRQLIAVQLLCKIGLFKIPTFKVLKGFLWPLINCGRMVVWRRNGHNGEPIGNESYHVSLTPTASLSSKMGVPAWLGGTAAAVPPPLRLGDPRDPALYGSHPLVTPYYCECRLGDLLWFFCMPVCLLYFCVICIFFVPSVLWYYWLGLRAPIILSWRRR